MTYRDGLQKQCGKYCKCKQIAFSPFPLPSFHTMFSKVCLLGHQYTGDSMVKGQLEPVSNSLCLSYMCHVEMNNNIETNPPNA